MPEHEIFHQRGESTSFTFTGGELKMRETDISTGYGVRVLKDGKVGFAYCQREDGLDDALAKAGRTSRFSVESGFSFPPASSFPKLEICNDSFDPNDYKQLHSLLSEARDAAESLGGKCRIIAEVGKASTSIENTSGFHGTYDESEVSVYVECMDADGFGIGYDASNIRLPDTRALGMKAAQMAKDMQGAKKPEGGLYTVVVELEALQSLVDTLLPSFSGDWKRRGITRLEQGKRMFHEGLTLQDDPLGRGSEARPFDDEGTVSDRRYLIKDGAVQSFLYDRENAALAGLEEGGACSRSSYADAPVIGGSNITISPGGWQSLDELGRYLQVHQMHGSHTANPTTGDIGLEVSTAFLVDRGEKVPVKGFMLTDNVFDLFSKIEAMERDVRTMDYLTAPRIAFRDVRAVV